jgi:MtN3 and saliva related transmembrane protein
MIIKPKAVLAVKLLLFRLMNATQILGLAAGICTATSLLPQVIKTLKEKKAEDVSIIMLLVLQAGLILWIIYGIKRNDFPIIITNCFSLLVNITMVILRIKYSRKKLTPTL